MKTLQEIIDERHERENALFRARSKAVKTRLKIEQEIYEKERKKQAIIWLVIGAVFFAGVLILANIETSETMNKCLQNNSRDYCEQKLGAR